MKRLSLLLALGLATAALAATTVQAGGHSGARASTTTITVGGIYPLTGAVATAGTNDFHGAELAVDVLNGKYPNIPIKPLKGFKISLDVVDSQSDPQVGAAAVSRLVQTDGAKAIVGGYQSAVTLTAARQSELFEVPFVNGASGATSLTRHGLKWFFRTGPNSKMAASTWYHWLKSIRGKHPVKRVAIIADNDASGQDFAFQTAYEAHRFGYKLTDTIIFSGNATDLTSQVAKLKAGHPDAIFAQMFINDTVLFLKTLAQLGYTPPAILAQGGGWDDPTFITTAGNLANNAIRVVSWGPMIDAKSKLAAAVDKVFTERYGVGLNGDSAREFTALITLGQAIQKANSDNPTKIRTALRGLHIPPSQLIMPWRGISFDPAGQNEQAGYLVLQNRRGNWIGLYPSGVAQGKVVWPFPTLKP